MKTSKEMARLFYEQTCGVHSGHMAMIPNNNVLYSICKVSSAQVNRGNEAMTLSEFRDFCYAIADVLDE